jgi:hypothetical protein
MTNSRQGDGSQLNFADVLNAAAPVAAAGAYVGAGNNAGLLTSATMTSVMGAAQTFDPNYGTPYLNTASPFAGGGYGYGSVPFAGGYAGAGAGVPGSAGYGVSGAPSQDYMEKQALFEQMNSANWEMLLAQVTVNDLSRDFTARSQILKTKSDTEKQIAQNMRA